ncbi:MAG: pyruvate kinase [Nitrospiraceae bacterium]
MQETRTPHTVLTASPDSLAVRVSTLLEAISTRIVASRDRFAFTNATQQQSRDNLLAYLALREHDLLDLQMDLAEQGLSSLGRLEGSVVATLTRVLERLDVAPTDALFEAPTATQATTLLAERSIRLLGRPRQHHHTRIMVTLNAAVLRHKDMIEQLLLAGMDIARINCAHDTAAEWRGLIAAIRESERMLVEQGRRVGRQCRIVMDLAGPKTRTGALALVPCPLKLAIEKDSRGRPIRLLEGWLTTDLEQSRRIDQASDPCRFVLSVTTTHDLGRVNVGDHFELIDTRGRRRRLRVLARIDSTRLRVGTERTTYLETGIELRTAQGLSCRIATVAPPPVDIRVQAGDRLRIYRDPTRLGHPAGHSHPAGIACTLPAALDAVQPGHSVFIDDGKIAGTVLDLHAATSPSASRRPIRLPQACARRRG